MKVLSDTELDLNLHYNTFKSYKTHEKDLNVYYKIVIINYLQDPCENVTENFIEEYVVKMKNLSEKII